jgi:hypothetical protein
MANPNQPAPGSRGPNPGSSPTSNPTSNPSSNPSANPSRNPPGSNPGGYGGSGQGGRKEDETRRSGGDTSGEMEEAGGGRKTADNPSFDPSRSNRGGASGSSGISSGSATTAPGRSSSVEPQRGAGEGNDDDVERQGSSDRTKPRQQGC